MGARILSFAKPGDTLQVESVRRERYANACLAGLRWVRDGFGLLALATLLAWLVVWFAH